MSAAAIAVVLLAQWLLATMLAFASGQSDAPAPSLLFDWKWVLPWLLPEVVLVGGFACGCARWRSGRGFRRSWEYTLGLSFASLVVVWLLYGITD